QTWFSFFNGWYACPTALPINALFFFESETAGLMFVGHRWPESFHWWLFSCFAREDAAAGDECGHDCPESPKRYLLHCGVLRRSTPPRAIISSTTYLVLRNSSWQLGDIGCDPSRLDEKLEEPRPEVRSTEAPAITERKKAN